MPRFVQFMDQACFLFFFIMTTLIPKIPMPPMIKNTLMPAPPVDGKVKPL